MLITHKFNDHFSTGNPRQICFHPDPQLEAQLYTLEVI